MQTLGIMLEFKEERISDLLHGHGGSYSPWMHNLTGKWNTKRGARIRFDLEDESATRHGKMFVGREEVRRGLAIFAVTYPHAFALWLEENDDDQTFDAVWQCIVYGKEVWN